MGCCESNLHLDKTGAKGSISIEISLTKERNQKQKTVEETPRDEEELEKITKNLNSKGDQKEEMNQITKFEKLEFLKHFECAEEKLEDKLEEQNNPNEEGTIIPKAKRYPSGYHSDLSLLSKLEEGRIINMKNHPFYLSRNASNRSSFGQSNISAFARNKKRD